MKRDFLTSELGLSKEVTEKIMAQYGESVNSLREENKRLAEENADFKQKAEEAQGLKGKVEELSAQVGTLTQELEGSKIEGALSNALIGAGAKNLKAVSALIDKSKIQFTDEGVSGIDEQIEAIKSDCDYLFYDSFKASGMRHSSQAVTEDGFTSFARAAAKLN